MSEEFIRTDKTYISKSPSFVIQESLNQILPDRGIGIIQMGEGTVFTYKDKTGISDSTFNEFMSKWESLVLNLDKTLIQPTASTKQDGDQVRITGSNVLLNSDSQATFAVYLSIDGIYKQVLNTDVTVSQGAFDIAFSTDQKGSYMLILRSKTDPTISGIAFLESK